MKTTKEKSMQSSKTLKTWALAIAMAFAVSPLAFAADKTGAGKGQQSGYQGQTSTTGQTGQSSMGQMGQGQGMQATVQDVDRQAGTVTLQSTDGKSVELQVPQSMLSDLQAGDSVRVSIQKSESGQQGMQRQQGTSPSGGSMPRGQ
jgi:Cu/Ag efflux protein CusF